jgi:hypothetical protein
MCKSIGLLFAVLLAVPSCTVAQGENKTNILEEMRRREKEIKESEARQEWKKIAWRSTPAVAVADAAKENKPLLIVLVVGERGRPKAERC